MFLTFWQVPPSQKLPSGKTGKSRLSNGLQVELEDTLQHISHSSSPSRNIIIILLIE